MADLVAGTARRSITGHKKFATFYNDHLIVPSSEAGREIDVGPAAVKCLKKLDPKDKSESGRSGVLLP